ncbi:MAG: exonuclease domain-containing protein [Pseudomonadota bacterium]
MATRSVTAVLDSFDQTEEPRRRRGNKPLPERYYLEHFEEMLRFVEQHYRGVLDESAQRFLNEFSLLSLDERCLYTRLASRKGCVYRQSRLSYPEINDLPAALAGLTAKQWLTAPGPEHRDDVLATATRAELLRWLRLALPGVARGLRKADYVALVQQHCDPAGFVAGVADSLFTQRHVQTVKYLTFLYFGEYKAGLSAFTMRDLGLLRTRAEQADYEPRFLDLDEARSCFFYTQALAETAPPTSEWPTAVGGAALRLRDKLAKRCGREAERAGELDTALAAYQQGETGDCLTGAVRCLVATDRRAAAEQLLERRIAAPRSSEERLVAEDLLARKFRGQKISRRTDFLRDADTIMADQALLGCPEEAVVSYFERRGQRAMRVENRLWRSLFGLLFWDLVATEPAHSPFESLPASLVDGTFADRLAEPIAARLALCESAEVLIRVLTKTAVSAYGQSNGVFRWRRDTLELVTLLVRAAPAGSLAPVLSAMTKDFRTYRHGWPDLMVVTDTAIEFVEVKAEGDQLRRSQWQRIEELRAAGFAAVLMRVQWSVDPEQTFVVVDVETTGGRGDHHRITEFAAVKVKGGQVIDRYQSLLHPQRAIPSSISRLTGITEAMVASAPTFAEKADEIDEFLSGSIFVAHNVAFDYRFVRGEFARLGRSFRAPKLCTCSQMRRFFPGRRSYSLRALCDEFNIPLRQHHRALCDAEAAAELLFMINDARHDMLGTADTPPL